MGDLTVCQPGWLALFARVDDEFADPVEEPIACWLLIARGEEPAVHPICALGGEMCDATLAGNFIGVIAPHDAHTRRAIMERWRAERRVVKERA